MIWISEFGTKLRKYWKLLIRTKIACVRVCARVRLCACVCVCRLLIFNMKMTIVRLYAELMTGDDMTRKKQVVSLTPLLWVPHLSPNIDHYLYGSLCVCGCKITYKLSANTQKSLINSNTSPRWWPPSLLGFWFDFFFSSLKPNARRLQTNRKFWTRINLSAQRRLVGVIVCQKTNDAFRPDSGG